LNRNDRTLCIICN